MCKLIDKTMGYPHFMLKEIYEQPGVIKEMLKGRLTPEIDDIILENTGLIGINPNRIQRIIIIACGTSYHAGLAGEHLIEKLAGIPVEVEMASEFRYEQPIADKNSLVIAISQSGETADTLEAMRKVKAKGARVLALTNVEDSTLAKEADFSFCTCAGPEIAIASTKAYTSQLTAIYLLALKLAYVRNKIHQKTFGQMKKALSTLSEQAQEMLASSKEIEKLVGEYKDMEKILYLGRGLDYALALEGSLKLQETCYIHSAAYPLGEFRHGPIALVEDGLLAFFLATQDTLIDKTLDCLQDIKTRGAHVIALAKEGNREIGKIADRVIYIPETLDEFTSALAVMPLQLFAYYTAVARGHNVDAPRNLVKSITD